MAKSRERKPSQKASSGWTTFTKGLKKAFGVDERPAKARRQRSGHAGSSGLVYAGASGGKGQRAQAKGQKKSSLGEKLLGALILGALLTRERQKSSSRGRHAHQQATEDRQTAVQENPPSSSGPQSFSRGPSPRGRGALIALIVVALVGIVLFWLNAQQAPANMLHVHLNSGSAGSHSMQFIVQQGQHVLVQIGFDVIQLLLVLTVAVVETLLVGLFLDRAGPLRLLEALVCALVGIWIFTHLVPLVWKGDYKIDGIPFFTTVIGAFLALLVFHMLLGRMGSPAAATLPPPVNAPPAQNGPVGTPVAVPPGAAAPPVAAPPVAAPPFAAPPVAAPMPGAAPSAAAPGATVPGVQLLFHSQRAGIDPSLVEQLVSFILATEHSLDGAVYDLRHPQVLQALATVAHGKRLRLAVDAGKSKPGLDPKPSGNQEALQQAGLSSHATSVHEGNHLMHDKFLIRDGRTVWTGSANFTSGGLGLQDNNCLIVDSPELAQQYEATFLDLISGHHEHRPSKGRSVMGQPVQVGGATITPGFAPAAGEGIENTVISLLHGARKVRIMAFLIGDAGILEALEQVRNADVKGIYDPSGMEDVLRSSRQDRSHFWFLHDPRFVAAPSHAFHEQGEQDFMHNKVFIINDEWVVTGSYNFSENAEANDENVLAIQSPAIAAAYTNYFDALYTLYRQHPGQFKEPAQHQASRRGRSGGKKGRGGRGGKKQSGWSGFLKLFQG